MLTFDDSNAIKYTVYRKHKKNIEKNCSYTI